MATKVWNLNADKLFKITKLNLRGRAKEWFKKLNLHQQLHVLNETLINFFGKGTNGKVGPSITFSTTINNRCQYCSLEEHTILARPKLADTKPKCAKCGGGHTNENCGLKCSFCFGLGHTENKCWKKFVNGLSTTTNFLEVWIMMKRPLFHN